MIVTKEADLRSFPAWDCAGGCYSLLPC